MANIIPSIIAKSFEEVKSKLARIDGLTDWAELDIMDGRFVTPVSWDVPEDLLNVQGRIKLEAHLMVKEPEETLKEWMNYVDRVIVHAEATDHLADILEAFDGSPANFGVALKIDTPIDVLDDFEGKITNVQLMSIDTLGHYGAKFDDAIYDRVREVRAKYPEMKISVDGGITLDNAPKLVEAGADNLIVGSAIWNSDDIAATLKKFQDL
jgi:ribulose-phosphate 3-epimerase